VVNLVASVLPPLRDLIDAILADADKSAGALGLIGAVTLAWGASRFMVSFGDALSRVMGRTHQRGLVARNAIAIAAVVLLPVALVLAAGLGGAASFIDAAETTGALSVVGPAVHVGLSILPLLAIVIALAIVYRVLPTPAPSRRAVVLPSIATGIVVAVLAQVFAFLAPRLVGAAAVLGTLAAVFAALAWLGLSFQAILIGGAWVGERDEPAARELGPTDPA
jgi:YihY family inner membrane protein